MLFDSPPENILPFNFFNFLHMCNLTSFRGSIKKIKLAKVQTLSEQGGRVSGDGQTLPPKTSRGGGVGSLNLAAFGRKVLTPPRISSMSKL